MVIGMGSRRGRRTRRDRQRDRESAIVAATRMLLDERGARDASVEQIARAAGMSKPDVYRTVDSKQEIFVLVLTDYLAELTARGPDAPEPSDAAAELREACLRYLDFCIEYPAFVDCAWSLLQWPAVEMREEISGSTWSRLGQALSAWLGGLERILAAGAKQGKFEVDDPAFTANRLGVQMLGSMQLARFGRAVRDGANGATTFELEPERVREACLEDALAVARSSKGGRR